MNQNLKIDTNMTETRVYTKPISLAGAVIKHPELGLLLQLRDSVAPTFPHHWGLFGGHIEMDEDPDGAIWRELQEELQLTPPMVSAPQLGQEFAHPSGGRVYIYYMTTTATLDDLVLGEGESMTFAQVDELDVPNGFQGHFFTTVSAQALQTYLATQTKS